MRLLLALFLCFISMGLFGDTEINPSFDYDIARTHEIKPHQREIPLKGVEAGFNQLHLTLTVSPSGNVLDANADARSLDFWPQLKDKVLQWKFIPFEQNGNVVTATVEEYIDLVPPERLPNKHVVPPVIHPDSKISISLHRTGCFGTCPSYSVTISDGSISFDGSGYVVVLGKHTAKIDSSTVGKLAKRFVAADFYSMDSEYAASVTDNPTYILSISIDGRDKKVEDYVGSWEGMPAVITELEDAVDETANTQRWIAGSDGLVDALEAENFNFQSVQAQRLLKQAAYRGQTKTVRSLFAVGVPVYPLAPSKSQETNLGDTGLLESVSRHAETLQVLLDAGVSKTDQTDKDLALLSAAGSGDLAAVRALIAYGAKPNADLSVTTVTENSGGMTMTRPGADVGSVLIYAAESGNPDVVREILRYHPALEARDRRGKTAMFAAGDYRSSDKDGARVECVRLLAEAGANVNARDNEGNTPLHEIYLTDVEEELLKLGADVNARNKDGETPIFTNVDNDSIYLFIQHGANLSIRNNKGEDVAQAAKEKGPERVKSLSEALEKLAQH